MSAELNSTIGAGEGSADADARSSKPVAEDGAGGPVTQTPLEVGSVCGSNAAESTASVAGLSFLSSDGASCSLSRARALTGAISWV